MITINKNITITIDKGDVPVLEEICEMARRYITRVDLTLEYKEERVQEIYKFINIIFEKVK